MFIGGIRALLLQSLHPLAMAAVAGHSGYRSDPSLPDLPLMWLVMAGTSVLRGRSDQS